MGKRTNFLKLLLLAVLVVAITGCQRLQGNNDPAEVEKTEITFEWWGSEVRHEKYLSAIALFEEKNPDINVIPKYDSWEDYWRRMSTKAASGELPDVFQMGDIYLAQYAAKDLLFDLSDKRFEELLRTDEVSADILNFGVVNQELVALPAATNAMGLLVNQQLMEEAGLTPDYQNMDFQGFLETIITAHEKTGAYGYMDVGDNYILLQYFLRTKGEDISSYDEEGRPQIAYTKASFVDFMSSIRRLAQAGALTPPEVMANLKSFDESPFATNQAVFVQTWGNQLVTYQESAKEAATFTIEVPYDSLKEGIFSRPATLYSVAKTTKEPEAAARLLDFLLNDQEANLVMGIERGVPANEKISGQIYDSLNKKDQAVVDYQETVKKLAGAPATPPPLGAGEITSYFKELYAEVYYGELTPEESYDRFLAYCQKVYDREY